MAVTGGWQAVKGIAPKATHNDVGAGSWFLGGFRGVRSNAPLLGRRWAYASVAVA